MMSPCSTKQGPSAIKPTAASPVEACTEAVTSQNLLSERARGALTDKSNQ